MQNNPIHCLDWVDFQNNNRLDSKFRTEVLKKTEIKQRDLHKEIQCEFIFRRETQCKFGTHFPASCLFMVKTIIAFCKESVYFLVHVTFFVTSLLFGYNKC